MTHAPLTLQRFLELVEAYGGQLSRWPAGERDAAQALIRVSEPARAALAAEAELDGVLASSAAPDVSPALSRRLNEIPIRAPAVARARWPFQRVWAPALGWAAAAALGVALGSGIGGWDSDEGPSDSRETGAEAAESQAPSDEALASLALGSFADLEETP
jgi:hypothetical protein